MISYYRRRWRNRLLVYLSLVCVYVFLPDADETADAHVAEFALSNQ